MTIVSCPKCHDQVSVPSGIGSQERVRCPLCREEYALATALASLPPALEVVDPSESKSDPLFDSEAADEAILSAQDSIEEFPPEDEPSEDVTFAPRSDSKSHAEPHNEPQTEPDSSLPRAITVPRVGSERDENTQRFKPSGSSRSRSRHKPASPLKAIFQVAGGGVLGLMIAQMILWWMPGDWARTNRDPFGLAAVISDYVPAILPEHLRTPDLALDSSPGPADQPPASPETPPTDSDNGTDPSIAIPAAAGADHDQSPTDIPADAAQAVPSTDPVAPSSTDVPDTSSDIGQTPPRTAPAAEPGSPTAAPRESLTNNAAANSTSPPDSAPPEVIAPAPAQSVAVDLSGNVSATRPAPASSVQPDRSPRPAPDSEPEAMSAELKARLDTVPVALQDWSAAAAAGDKSQMTSALIALYDALARLGESSAARNPASSAEDPGIELVRGALRQVLQTKPADTPVYLARWAVRQLDDSNAGQSGVVVYGTVIASQTDDGQTVSQLRLASQDSRVVLLVQAGSASLPVGSKLLAIGTLDAEASPQAPNEESRKTRIAVSCWVAAGP